MSSTAGSMARLVINNSITSGGALAPGQVLQLGGFTIGARTAVKPKAAPTIAKHDKEHPMDITMSRVHLASDTCHIYFIHTKVNHLLYMCPLVPFEDGILLDPSLVCIHRCERSYTFIEEESKKKRTSTPSKREAWKRRRKCQEEGSSSQATSCPWVCTVPTGPPCP